MLAQLDIAGLTPLVRRRRQQRGHHQAAAERHVGRILAELGLHDRAGAVVLADETGLVTPGGYSTEE
jgi:hypothetical protein